MCDFTPVRNALIALAVFVGLAVSSAFFAWGWTYSKTPWGAIVASVCFWVAATWCMAAGVALGILLNAVRAFCACARKVNAACASPCDSIEGAIFTLAAALLTMFITCGALGSGASGVDATVALFLLVIAFFIAAFGTVMTLIGSLNLASCQSAPRPGPPSGPPGGTGPTPM